MPLNPAEHFAGGRRVVDANGKAECKRLKLNREANRKDTSTQQLARMKKGVAEHPDLFRDPEVELARRFRL